MYHEINEATARRAKEANSFRDYVPGSATDGYRASVDKAAQIAEEQKAAVDPMYHGKIDALLETYSRKLAANLNHGYEIDARVPSMMITGGSNFPVAKKEKQNAARDRNLEEWNEIQGLLDKIRSTGTGGISSDDPAAIDKLKEKLAALEETQQLMKDINAYYRKHKTFDGCPYADEATLQKIHTNMGWFWKPKPEPFASWALSNNNANIHCVQDRIAQMERKAEKAAEAAALPEGDFDGWEFDGGRVLRNHAENRLQILFDGKPEQELRTELKHYGFRWSPSQGAWQRMLSSAAERDARIVLKALLKGE